MTALVALGALIRVPGLDSPLLEGAAGKQTHIAMVARNLHRGDSTFARPRIDDVGEPGYFVKELPVLQAAAAMAYGVAGTIDERILRTLPALAWLVGIPLLAGLLAPSIGPFAAGLAGLWMAIAPIAVVYSRTALNDSPAVILSLAALAVLVAWRKSPSATRALGGALLVGVAFLLKPHTAIWLGPAAAYLCLARGPEGSPERPSPGALATIGAAAAVALVAAGQWYLHAAAIHEAYPVPGATVASGWVAPALLGDPRLYAEIARQTIGMVFTPVGAAIAAYGVATGPRLSLVERALLAWGAGVVLQCLVFAPRMFDALSRGTEYYQLPLVVTAAALIGRGLAGLASHARAKGAGLPWAVGAIAILLLTNVVWQERRAAQIPTQYATLLEDCAVLQEQTSRNDRFVVLADRGGTVLYYCDRKGVTFSLGKAVHEVIRDQDQKEASPAALSRALAGATHLYIPFPDLLDQTDTTLARLGAEWDEVPLPGSNARLYRRPGAPRR